MKTKHTTVRLSEDARERLERLASDYASQSATLEEALISLENNKIAYGQQVYRAMAHLIAATHANDAKDMSAAQAALATLLRSTTAAAGIGAALVDSRQE